MICGAFFGCLFLPHCMEEIEFLSPKQNFHAQSEKGDSAASFPA
jgi:hypothetical protein